MDSNQQSSDFLKMTKRIKDMLNMCDSVDNYTLNQEEFISLSKEIATKKMCLMAYLCDNRRNRIVRDKYVLRDLIKTAKHDLSHLEYDWNSLHIVSVTEMLSQHFNAMNKSNSVLNVLNTEVVNLDSIYCFVRQSLEHQVLKYQDALTSWVECEKELKMLEKKIKVISVDYVIGTNHTSRCFGSVSDSGMSDSDSMDVFNKHKKRLVDLEQLILKLMIILTPGNEELVSMLARIEKNEKQLKKVHQTFCKGRTGRSALCREDNKLDCGKNLVKTVDAEKTVAKTSIIRDARTRWIACLFYLFIVVLCGISWLEPQRCDMVNNDMWSFSLRYMNGPPPT